MVRILLRWILRICISSSESVIQTSLIYPCARPRERFFELTSPSIANSEIKSVTLRCVRGEMAYVVASDEYVLLISPVVETICPFSRNFRMAPRINVDCSGSLRRSALICSCSSSIRAFLYDSLILLMMTHGRQSLLPFAKDQ